jgi:neopullulanase
MNTDTKERTLDFSSYPERTTGFSKAENVLSKEVFNTTQKQKIAPMRMWVLELKR